MHPSTCRPQRGLAETTDRYRWKIPQIRGSEAGPAASRAALPERTRARISRYRAILPRFPGASLSGVSVRDPGARAGLGGSTRRSYGSNLRSDESSRWVSSRRAASPASVGDLEFGPPFGPATTSPFAAGPGPGTHQGRFVGRAVHHMNMYMSKRSYASRSGVCPSTVAGSEGTPRYASREAARARCDRPDAARIGRGATPARMLRMMRYCSSVFRYDPFRSVAFGLEHPARGPQALRAQDRAPSTGPGLRSVGPVVRSPPEEGGFCLPEGVSHNWSYTPPRGEALSEPRSRLGATTKLRIL